MMFSERVFGLLPPLIFAAVGLPVPQALAAGRSPVGTNLARIDDWSTDFPFADAFRTSRTWISGTNSVWDDQRPIDLGPHGWVRSLQTGQIARTLMFWSTNMSYPPGRYVVEYEGQGTLQYWGGARLTETAPGRDVLDVDPSRGGIAIFITAVNPANYLRNIRVYRPLDATDGELFNPLFLDRIKNYRVLRFMDWMATNGNWTPLDGSRQQRWTDRPTVEDARWSGNRGVPLETMAALANRLGADAWFCMPHLAENDYVRQFARTAMQLLDPSLKVYVEYSNEVWNSGYAQAWYAQQQGLALGLSSNEFEARIRFHSRRSREIFAIWEEVFPRARLVRVLGSQAANPWVSATALAYGDTAAHTDSVAIAPYFGIPSDQGRLLGMNLTQLMAELETVQLSQVRTMMNNQAALTRQYGVGLIAYEAGQHLVAVGSYQGDPVINALFDAANRDARMGHLYWQYLQDWGDATGGQLLVHFTHCGAYSPYGRFGTLETEDQPRAGAPKYDMLQRWITGWDQTVRYGDVNNSQMVDITDMQLLAERLAGNTTAPLPAADVYQDGRLDALDLQLLAQYLAQRLPALPIFH